MGTDPQDTQWMQNSFLVLTTQPKSQPHPLDSFSSVPSSCHTQSFRVVDVGHPLVPFVRAVDPARVAVAV